MAEFDGLFEILPLDQAMPTLLAPTPLVGEAAVWVNGFAASPLVKAALWLYVDDLEQAHELVQDLNDPTGSYLHAILHRREGDFSNSKYWFRQAGRHPILAALAPYDPLTFVDDAKAAENLNPPDVLALQRAEWKAIFDYAVAEGI